MKVIFNLGLGDAIVCAPIIAKLATLHDVVEIPCWEHNQVSVRSLFVNHPNVDVRPFKTESDMLEWSGDTFHSPNIELGHYKRFGIKDQRSDEDFVQWFYRQAGMDISEKEKYCPIINASKSHSGPVPVGEYNFVHEDPARGFWIKNVQGYRPYYDRSESDDSILKYAEAIINAKEVHCIDSSFIHLAEALPTKGKLFYHKYARPNSTDFKYFKKQWEVIE